MQTLTGKMSEGVQEGAAWSSVIRASEPCEIFQISGKGKVPAECTSDFFVEITFSASGRVKSGVLELTSIRCTSKRML